MIAALEQSYSWKDLDDALGEKQHPPSDVLYSALCCPEDCTEVVMQTDDGMATSMN